MPGAIADASTLIHLATIGRLELLRALHGRIVVPPAVWREVVLEGRGRPGAAEAEDARKQGWLDVVAPARADLVRALRGELDDGEAEALALAVERGADVLYVDETEARRTADLLGVRKSGVIGVLVRAHREGLVPDLKAELARLREESGFWIRPELFDRLMREAESG